MKEKYHPIIFSLLIVCGILIGVNISKPEKTPINNKINAILQLIDSHYVDSLSSHFEEDVINSIIKDLDPHTTYISKENYQSVEENMLGGFSGIGIEFNIIDDTIVVVSPINGGPSEKLGIISGDRIVEVDSSNVASIGIENSGVIKRLRGEKGTSVSIKIKRRGIKNLIEFNITRNTIPLNSIDVSMMINNTTGFIKLNRFSAKTTSEFNAAITDLFKNGMEQLILDLRDNPGGYLSAAVNICDKLLNKEELIVYTQGRMRDKSEIYSRSQTILKDNKLVVLINEGSASASEIIAGAVQDNDRGIIIGRRSFGKGLVQEEIKLNDGAAIRLTTQRYYTPSGRSIQKDYQENNEEYFLEQYLRNDSIIPDSLKYKTRLGRTVYGGGGINPDIIIAKDTSLNYKLLNEIIIKGWIRDFSMQYSDQNRNNLFKIADSQEYLKRMEEIILNRFINYITKKDKNLELDLKAQDKLFLKKQITANIARNLWSSEDYYRIIIDSDEYIKKAIEVIYKN